MLTQKIIEKEFALSGSEQNPDLTGKDIKLLLSRVKKGAPGPIEAFKQHGDDFVVADNLTDLVRGMNKVGDKALIVEAELRELIEARDREIDNTFTKDAQVTAIRGARTYRGDKLIRVATPHKLLDPKAGPLIAVRLNILTRKTLGGLETDLDGRCLTSDGTPLPGLYAAGEVNGFGGGGMMGYNALEGTFLGGCLFSGRTAGRGGRQGRLADRCQWAPVRLSPTTPATIRASDIALTQLNDSPRKTSPTTATSAVPAPAQIA